MGGGAGFTASFIVVPILTYIVALTCGWYFHGDKPREEMAKYIESVRSLPRKCFLAMLSLWVNFGNWLKRKG